MKNAAKKQSGKREIVRGELSPRPLFIWAGIRICLIVRCRIFSAMLRLESLEIHKVFLRLSTLSCEKTLAAYRILHILIPTWCATIYAHVGELSLHVLYY